MDSESLTFQASAHDTGKRLDAFLAEKIEGWSRSRLKRLIEDGDVTVNQKEAKSSYKLKESDEIEVELTESPVAQFEPENIPLDIVFEDESFAVINKPSGMVVHPGAGNLTGTLANAIAYKFRVQEIPNPKSQIPNRIGLVHRLDKDTSGLIAVAKSEEIHEALSEQFRKRSVYKSYIALVHGEIRGNSGRIEQPVARDRRNRLKMSVDKNGRYALSLWKVRQRFAKFTLVDVEIKTGRTHQIRVHLSYLNHPIVGDELYNAGRDKTVADLKIRQAIQDLNRFFLHAEKLSLTHPVNGQSMNFVAPLPAELEEFLNKIA